jgi:hypothetical protein
VRWLWRVLAVVAVFVGVGYATMHLLVARAVARGAPEYSVRLGGAVGGLFVGGGAAVVIGLALLLGGKSDRSQ